MPLRKVLEFFSDFEVIPKLVSRKEIERVFFAAATRAETGAFRCGAVRDTRCAVRAGGVPGVRCACAMDVRVHGSVGVTCVCSATLSG